MENPTLAEGATFSDVVEATQNADATPPQGEATPPEGTPEATAATEGGTPAQTPEAEVPGILKDPDPAAEEDEGKPDLSLDADLEKHPVLKAKWEAYKAQKEKGIDKFIAEEKARSKDLEEWKSIHEPIIENYNALRESPEAAWKAVDEMAQLAEVRWGPRTGGSTLATAEPADGDSRYGFEFASDDKVVDTAIGIIVPQIKALLDERLGPIAEDFNATKAAREASAKAEAAMPVIKAENEISSAPWVTKEMVAEAMQAYPGLDPAAAFRAKYTRQIIEYNLKHSQGGRPQEVRNLPSPVGGARMANDLKEGASMIDIFSAQGTLG